MELKTRLGRNLDNPLEWDSSAKAVFLLGVTLVMHLSYVLWAHFVLSHPGFESQVRYGFVRSQLGAFHGILLVSLALFVGVLWRYRRGGSQLLHEYLATHYYGLSHCYFAWVIGALSLPTGIVLAGAPVLGFIFFDQRAVLGAFASASVALLLMALLSVQGHLPYGPAVGEFARPDGSISVFWAGSYIFFSIPHLAMLFGLAVLVLRRWREREEEVRVMSITDPLTGLLNRRSILAHFKREQGRSSQQGTPMAVVMLDLDHFKQINDIWGHEAGDRVLVAAAEVLQKAVRQMDRVGRYGGEEFLLVLPGADRAGAQRLADRCRQQVAALDVVLSDGRPIRVTASMGVYCNETDRNASVDTMLSRADKALYAAKQSGRNRVVLADEPAG